MRLSIANAIIKHLDQSPAVDGYQIPRSERLGRNLYRIWDSALDLDHMVNSIIDSLGLTKELRCGELLAVDDPIDTETHFSSQHRYITNWMEP